MGMTLKMAKAPPTNGLYSFGTFRKTFTAGPVVPQMISLPVLEGADAADWGAAAVVVPVEAAWFGTVRTGLVAHPAKTTDAAVANAVRRRFITHLRIFILCL